MELARGQWSPSIARYEEGWSWPSWRVYCAEWFAVGNHYTPPVEDGCVLNEHVNVLAPRLEIQLWLHVHTVL